jgi:hypothetical protein
MPQLATFSSNSYDPDRLIAGPSDELLSRQITLITGQNLVRGALLGKIATAGTVAAAAAAGNTGNGTLTGLLTVNGPAKEGVYRAVCIEPGANVGTFAIFDPQGIEVGTATVAVAFVGPINFTINDGATDFISGDTFNITVSAVTYKYKLAVAAATDGSAEPDAILAEDTDATAADKRLHRRLHRRVLQLDRAHVRSRPSPPPPCASCLRNKGIHLIPSSAPKEARIWPTSSPPTY